eukprot:gene11652-biopygen1909
MRPHKLNTHLLFSPGALVAWHVACLIQSRSLPKVAGLPFLCSVHLGLILNAAYASRPQAMHHFFSSRPPPTFEYPADILTGQKDDVWLAIVLVFLQPQLVALPLLPLLRVNEAPYPVPTVGYKLESPITIVKGQDDFPWVNSEYENWNRFTLQRWRTKNLPGGHFWCNDPENIKIIAEWFNQVNSDKFGNAEPEENTGHERWAMHPDQFLRVQPAEMREQLENITPRELADQFQKFKSQGPWWNTWQDPEFSKERDRKVNRPVASGAAG